MLKANRSDRPPLAKKLIRRKSNNIEGPKNFNSRSFRKYIIYIIIFILLLFLSFIIFAPMFINLKVWKPEIISMLQENTGKTARIDGDIKLTIYPSPQVKVYDISLVDEESGVINNFFRSDSVIAKLSFFPLLKGNIEIERIVFDNLTLNLLNERNQRPNWVFEKNTSEKDGIDKFDVKEFSKFNQIEYPNIKVNEYNINNGTIIYNNTSKIDFDNISIMTNESSNILEGTIYIENNQFTLTSSFIKNNDNKDSWLTKFTLINNDIYLKSDLDVFYSGYFPDIKGKLEVSYNNINNILNNASIKYLDLMDYKTKFTGDLSLSFNNNDLFYSIFNINANMGASSFTGAISGNNGAAPEIEMAFSSNNIDLDLFIDKINNINKNSKSDKIKDNENYWHKHSGKFLLSIGTSKLLDYPIRNISIEIDKDKNKYTLKSANAIFPGNTDIKFNGLFKKDFSVFEGKTSLKSDNFRDFYKWLSIDLQNISDARMKKSNLKSEVVFRRGGATFAAIKGKIDSSDINGEVRLRFGEEKNAFVNIKIDKINLDSYLNQGEKNVTEDINKYDLLVFDIINFDIEIEDLLLFKNKYKNIILKNSLNNHIITIDRLDLLDFTGGLANITGEVDLTKKVEEYDLSIDFNHKDFTKVHDFYNFPKIFKSLIVGDGLLKISSKGRLNNLNSKVQFENSNTIILYNGEVKIQDYFINEYNGNLSISLNNIENTLNFAGEGETNYSSDIFKNNNELMLENISIDNSKYNLNGNLAINNEDEGILDLDIDLESTTLDILTIKNIYNYFYKDSNKQYKGDIKLKSDLFTIGGYEISDFDFFVSISDDLINLNRANGKLFGGSVNTEAEILTKNLYEYNGKLTFKNIKSSEFFNNYFSYNKFNSEINSELIINGQANNFVEFFDSMRGEGEALFKKNLFVGLDASNIININNVERDNLLNDVYKSFSNDKEKRLDEFKITYTYDNYDLKLQTFEVKIDDFFALLDGQLNFKTRNYNLSSKFFLNDDLNNFLSLNLSRTNDNILNSAESNSSIVTSDIKVNGQEEEVAIEDNSQLNDMTDSLSDENNLLNLDNDLQIDDEIKLDSPLIDDNQIKDLKLEIKETPLPMFIKNINMSNFISYYKPNSITNNLSIPKLPTEEDILDELLDSVLSP
ncbi:MAG: AsmA family protein [Alphaproteobacteria bacterium]|nr:AsmA family protein [Alphaproteobacteria bacterium]